MSSPQIALTWTCGERCAHKSSYQGEARCFTVRGSTTTMILLHQKDRFINYQVLDSELHTWMFSPGFGDRLLLEMRKLVPKDSKIRISAPPSRHLSTWTGASILGSLATFKQMWVTREDYEEEGCSVLHRKTF